MNFANRILIYGVTGSGKTTLAKNLSEVTGLPWHEADSLTWEPGWVMVDDEEQRRRISEVCKGDRWILDTAYGKWLEVPLDRAELIVALDYPRWLSFGRLFKRTMLRLVDGQPICNGNRETLKNFFSKDAILLWHFRSFKRKKARIEEFVARDMPSVLRMRSPSQTEQWLRSLTPEDVLNDQRRA
jgi:adenylate kinase family enzyme